MAAGSSSRSVHLALWLVGLIAVAGSSGDALPEHDSLNINGAHSKQTCPQAVQDGRETCPLWGCQGEGWSRTGLLGDWSFAGYGAGLEAIPSPPVTVDVKRDFHAAGNGVSDDTAAVKAAIDATRATGGVIYFPPGKYILSDQLFLSSYQVLRGAGRDHTNLRFTKSMVDLHGWGTNHTAGQGRSKYTWAGAMISNKQDKGVFAPNVNLHLGQVAKPAKRGDTRIYVKQLVRNASSAELLFQPGQWYTLALAENAQGDLARMLYNNKTAGGYSLRTFAKQFMLTHMSRVTAVGGDWIELERPLHVDVSMTHPAVLARTANYKVTGMGVEDLEVSFPWTPYMGHHEEAGYNAIEIVGSVSSWVRRIRIVNADSGVRLYGSMFNTISDVEITNSPWTRKGGRWVGRESGWVLTDMDGHMGIALHWASHDNLVENFNITGTYYHDLLVAVYSSRNVFHQGRGTDLCLDHHGNAPNNNLWTDIDVGIGNGAMRWSGDAGANPFAGKLNTFWGIRASALPVKVDYVGQLAASRVSMQKMQQAARLALFSRPADIQGYQQVVVDMPLDQSMPTIREAGDWLIHYDPDYRVYPGNLYTAMVATAGSRLKLSPNGTFLSDMYPRPATASAWKAVPVQHPAAGRPEQPKVDPDCLNLGCQVEKNASWARSAASTASVDKHVSRMIDHNSVAAEAGAPVLSTQALLNLSSSVVQSTTDWLSAAGKATLAVAGFGSATANSTRTPAELPVHERQVTADLYSKLRQVVSVASNLLVTLTGGLPAEPLAEAPALAQLRLLASPPPQPSSRITTGKPGPGAGSVAWAKATARKPSAGFERAVGTAGKSGAKPSVVTVIASSSSSSPAQQKLAAPAAPAAASPSQVVHLVVSKPTK